MQSKREQTHLVRTEQAFAQRMRELRELRGVSQIALAASLEHHHGIKLDGTAITRMEKNADGDEGARAIRLDEAAAIAAVLNTTVNDMVNQLPSLPEQLESAKARLRAARRAVLLANQEERIASRQIDLVEEQINRGT